MSPNAPAAPPPAIPADVAAFAAENGVTDYVVPLLELTRDLFPGAPITLLVQEDAEEPELRFIEFRVDVEGFAAEELAAASHEWSVGLFRRCPATRAHFFCLGML